MIDWNVFESLPCDHDWTDWRPAGDAESRWCRVCTLAVFRFEPLFVAGYMPEEIGA